jgi:hypothetical protein
VKKEKPAAPREGAGQPGIEHETPSLDTKVRGHRFPPPPIRAVPPGRKKSATPSPAKIAAGNLFLMPYRPFKQRRRK